MIKHFAIVMSVVALSMSSAFADEKQSTVVNQALQQAAEDQTIFAEFLLGAESVREMSAQRALLVRIDEWLAANFELPRATELPRVEYAPTADFLRLVCLSASLSGRFLYARLLVKSLALGAMSLSRSRCFSPR